MNKIIKYIGLFFIAISPLMLVTGCEEDDTDDMVTTTTPESGIATFILSVTPMSGNEVLRLNTPYFTDEDYKFQMLTLRLYASQIRLVRQDGTEDMIKDVDFIANYAGGSSDPLSPTQICIEVDTGTYTGIKFGVGLDSAINSTDPADYAIDHPLSYTQSTHWNWVLSYRFLIFEGRFDTIPNSTGMAVQRPLTYHTGTNRLYREVSFNENFTLASDAEYTFDLALDVKKILSGNNNAVALPDEAVSHTSGTEAIAEKVTNNLAEVGLYKP